jgi:hypothetical protein
LGGSIRRVFSCGRCFSLSLVPTVSPPAQSEMALGLYDAAHTCSSKQRNQTPHKLFLCFYNVGRLLTLFGFFPQHAKPWKENPATASKRPAVSPLQTQAPSPCLPPSLACSALLARIPASLRDGKPAPAPRSPCPGLPRSASRPSVSRLISVRAMARRGVPVAVVVEWPDNPDLAGFKLNRGCARGLFLGFP